jgi:bacterioferritin-associated ferredoxin
MFVCVCNKVTDSQIREACENGAFSMDCLKSQLKVATCCGRCHDCADRVMRESQAAQYRDRLSLATA